MKIKILSQECRISCHWNFLSANQKISPYFHGSACWECNRSCFVCCGNVPPCISQYFSTSHSLENWLLLRHFLKCVVKTKSTLSPAMVRKVSIDNIQLLMFGLFSREINLEAVPEHFSTWCLFQMCLGAWTSQSHQHCQASTTHKALCHTTRCARLSGRTWGVTEANETRVIFFVSGNKVLLVNTKLLFQ